MFHQAQATDIADLLADIETLASNSHVDTIAINAAGSGYVVGELVDINGGTVVAGLNATAEVLAIGGGGSVTQARLYNGGAYTANPGVGATTTTITGAGTGLTLDTTILATGWSVNRAALVGGGPERDLLLQGTGDGSDDIYLGFESYRNNAAGSFGLKIGGFTGFNNGFDFENQPGSNWQIADCAETRCPLNNGLIDYWLVIDTFHIKGVFRSGASYTNLYAGFINTYQTKGEYPYPLMVIGCADDDATLFNSTSVFLSGMHDPRGSNNNNDGPAAIREVDGQWYQMRNGVPGSGTSITTPSTRCIYPGAAIYANTAGAPQVDQFDGNAPSGPGRLDSWFGSLNENDPATFLFATPDSGGDFGLLWPTVIYQNTPSQVFLGELIDVYPTIVFGTAIVSEDSYTDVNGDTYLLFQNCNRTDSYAFFGIKRNF